MVAISTRITASINPHPEALQAQQEQHIKGR